MKKNIRDFNLENKKVIIRVDFNVPIKDNKITDDTRIKESLKTINYAIENNAKIILLSHLGRIKQESDLEKNTLLPVAKRLSELLNRDIKFINKTRGKEVEELVNNLKNKEILLIENTRYEDLIDKKESSNNLELGKYWSSLGDIFINDAFGTIHRSHASNVGIATNIPNGIGFLVEKELNELAKLDNPTKPYVVILGGSKVSDKIGVIENLIKKCDYMVIGGAMAFTFLKAEGYNVGKSLVEDDYLEFSKKILLDNLNKIILPVDVIASTDMNKESKYATKNITEIEDDMIGLDLGPKTVDNIKNILKQAKTVVWNGPLGYYELEQYQYSTKEILKYLTENNISTILGGGDIVSAANQLGYKEKVEHASTGGGATLEYLEGKELPGLKIIEDK